MALGSLADNQRCLVPIAEAYSYSAGAVLRGLSRDQLFKKSLLDPNTQNYMSLSQIVLLAMNTMAETEDNFYGYSQRASPPSRMILMMRVIMACKTLERAISSLVSFHERGRGVSIGLHTNGAEAQLCVSCDDALGGKNAPVMEDMYLSGIFGTFCYFLGRRFPATAVTTRNRAQPLDVRHWSMSAFIHLGSVAALHFPVALLAETRQGDPTDDICWSVLQYRLALDNEISAQAPDRSVSIRQLNATALCTELGISPATFRRRNSISGASFRRFREETLVEASLVLLADDTRSVGSIATELGYSDVRSYRRFIKGATGLTPDQLRTNDAIATMRAVEPDIFARIEEISTRLSR